MEKEFLVLLMLPIILFLSCGNEEQNRQQRIEKIIDDGRLLAQTYCTSCHSFPSPQALPKQVWEQTVLPNMGRRLGMERHSIMRDYPRINSAIRPEKQLLSQAEWNKIVNYYRIQSPNSLDIEIRSYPGAGEIGFNVSEFAASTNISAVISYLDIDQDNEEIVIGDALANKLLFFDYNFKLKREIDTKSPVVDVEKKKEFYYATTIGIMVPNDKRKGQIIKYHSKNNRSELVVDSLSRPVQSSFYDFDGDGHTDILVCEYGNNFGRLSVFFQDEDRSFKKRTIANTAGALKTILTDFNEDGKEDILALFAQGDERIDLFLNQGNLEFNRKTLLRFPPHYGTYDLHHADVNGDGQKELLYVNGDNGDYTRVLKPYHGLRIFAGKDRMQFQQEYFFPLHGASNLTLLDYDRDGDLDIGMTSTFPGEVDQAGPGILLLKNESTANEFSFTGYQVDQSVGHPYTLIGKGDPDRDGDQDLLVGSMNLISYGKFLESGDPYGDSTRSVLFLSNSGNQVK